MSKSGANEGKSLKNISSGSSSINFTGISFGEVITTTISTGGFTLDDVQIISGTIDGVLIGSESPAPGNFTSIVSGNPSGVGFTSIFYGNTIGEFLRWDPTLGEVDISGDLVVSQTTELGNVIISGNTISTKNTNGDLIINPNGLGGLVLSGDFTQNAVTGNVSFQTSDGGFSADVTKNFDVSSSEVNFVSQQEQTFNSTNGDIIIQSGSSKTIGIISSISTGNTPSITSSGHNLEVGDEINIIGSNSTPTVNGVFTVSAIVNANNFRITPGFNVTASGNSGTFTKNTDIYLTASNNINIPYDVRLAFGADSNYISSSSSPINDLSIASNSDINLLPRDNLNIQDSKGLTFGGDSQMIKGTSGVLSVTAQNSISLLSTTSVTGNFSVTGNSILNNTVVLDPIVTIGTQTVDTKDRGIEYLYNVSSRGYFGRDATDDYFMYIPNATNNSDIITGDLGNAKFNIGSFNSLSVASGGSISTSSLNVCTITCASLLNITGGTGINLTTPVGSRVTLVQGSILTLGSTSIVNTGSDLIASSPSHIYLTTVGDVIVQSGKSIVLNGLAGSQKITGSTTEITINSSSFLNLTQVSGGVKLTEGLPLIFSQNGNSNITASNGNLNVSSNGYINLLPASHVNLSVNKRLEFGTSNDYIGSNGFGNILLNASSFTSTTSGDSSIVSSSGNVLLTPLSFVRLPKNKSIVLGDLTEFIKSDTLNNISTSSLGNNSINAVNVSLNVTGFVELPHTKQLRFGSSFENILGTSGNIFITAATTTVSGNLTVNGANTFVNSTNFYVKDPIVTIGDTTVDNKDKGIEYKDGATLGFFGYDKSINSFTFIPQATNLNEVISGTPGNVNFGGGTFTSINTPSISNGVSGVLTIDSDTIVTGSLSFESKASFSVSGNDLILDVTTPGELKVNSNTVITGDLEITGIVSYPGLAPSVERYTVSSSANRNPENGVSITFVSVNGSGIATGTMPPGVIDGSTKSIIMSNIASNCIYELTFPTGRLVDPVSGSTVAKKMIFDRSGQSVFLIWDNTSSKWIIMNSGAELLVI